MSKRPGLSPDLAIEYSGRGITVFDPRTHSAQPFSDLGTVGAAYGGRYVVIGLSRRSVFVRTVRVPNASPEDIRQVLMVRAIDLFPVGPAELAIDFHLTEDINEEGRLAVVAAVPTVELRRIREDARAAGLRVLAVVPVATGAARIAQRLGRQNAAIVSRDQEGIGIDIVLNGQLRLSRVVPSNAAIEAEVCRTYSVAGIPCGDIVAADGVVLKDPDADTNESPLASLLDLFPVQLDLELPEEIDSRLKKKRDQHKRNAFLLAAGAAVTLAFVANDRMEETAAANDRIEQAQKPLVASKKALKDLETKITGADKNVATLNRAFQPAQRLGDVVLLMSNRTPAGVWLTGFTAERGKPTTVRGTATNGNDVARYLQNLVAEPRLRDVKFIAYSNTAKIEDKPVVQFTISAFPVGNLPLEDPFAKKTARSKK